MARLTGVLTDVQLRHWVKAKEPVAKSDGSGLTFTLSSKGAASWVLRYRFGGRQKEVTLGTYPDMSLNKAREIAAVKRVEVQQGVDLAVAKQTRKAEAAAPDTVKNLCNEFYDRTVANRIERPDLVREKLDNDVIRCLGAKKIKDVTPMDVDRMISGIVERGSPVMANRVLSLTKAVFDYAIRRHWIQANPASAFKLHDAGGAEKARERALDDADITAVFKAFEKAGPVFRPYALAVRLLLLSAVRKSELIEAPWVEFDLDGGVWVLPKQRQKTGGDDGAKDFVIPLTPYAIESLNELRLYIGKSDYLFPAKRRTEKLTLSPNTINWALKEIAHGVAHFSVHDLRRTARTHLAKLGILPHVAERYLNHKLPGINDTYDTYDYLDERRAAMGIWGAKLKALEAGEAFNVVPLRSAA